MRRKAHFHLLTVLLCATVATATSTEGARYLRGGRSSYSGGGGSWGGRSGGGSSSNNRFNNRNSNRSYRSSGLSTAGKVLGGLALGMVGLALLSMMFPAAGAATCGAAVACCPCLTGLCCGLLAGNAASSAASGGGGGGAGSFLGGGSGGAGGDHNFEEHVRRAKADVDISSSSYAVPQPGQPQSGEYSTSYTDLGFARTAGLSLRFTPSGNGGYTISGGGRDIDGSTVIEEGHVAQNGEAWWRERTVSGPEAGQAGGGDGLQVLSRGRFDFAAGMFAGTWYANTMAGGAYSEFRLISKEAGMPQSAMQQPYMQQPYMQQPYMQQAQPMHQQYLQPSAGTFNSGGMFGAPASTAPAAMGAAAPTQLDGNIPVVSGSVVVPQGQQPFAAGSFANSSVTSSVVPSAPPVVTAQPYVPPQHQYGSKR